MNHWNEDKSKRENVSSSSMITSPDSDMQQSITSNKNTIHHFEQEHIQSSTATNISRNIIIASCSSSDRHIVIYHIIHIRNNSPLHASSNKTATQNRQCKLSETTRTVVASQLSCHCRSHMRSRFIDVRGWRPDLTKEIAGLAW